MKDKKVKPSGLIYTSLGLVSTMQKQVTRTWTPSGSTIT